MRKLYNLKTINARMLYIYEENLYVAIERVSYINCNSD